MTVRPGTNPRNGQLPVSDARHGAAHALAHLYCVVPFTAIGIDEQGHCHATGSAASDAETAARIAMVGPCVDLAVDFIEDADLGLDVVGGTLESWRLSVADDQLGTGSDFILSGGLVEDTAEWALAFCFANADLIDAAASELIAADGPVAYDVFTARFNAQCVGVTTENLEDAAVAFVGYSASLGRIDEAVTDRSIIGANR